MVLADIGQHIIVYVVAGLGSVPLERRSDTCRINGLVQMGHFNKLVLDVGSFLNPIILSNGRGGIDIEGDDVVEEASDYFTRVFSTR